MKNPTSRPKRTQVLLAVVGCALVATGCAMSTAVGNPVQSQEEQVDESAAGNFLNEKKMGDEFLDAAANFPLRLPEGIDFPSRAPANAEPNTYSEPGVGEGIAVRYWLCAWEENYLQAADAGDARSQASAIEQIARFESLEWTKKFFVDPERGWYANVVATALEGDPSGVKQDYASGSCGFYEAAKSLK